MYYLPSSCLVLFFLYSLFHHLPCVSSKQELGLREAQFQCGNITAGFPFWGGNRHKDCGHPLLELRCPNNITSLTISNHLYYVHHIDQTSQTLRLSRSELEGSFCNATFTATTLPPQIFELSPTFKNLTVFYLYDPKLSYHSSYTCPGSSSISVSKNLDYRKSCHDSFTINVPKSFVPDEKELNLTHIESALREGFEVKLKIDQKACQDCSSHEICGFNNTTHVCCKEASSSACNTLHPPSPGSRHLLEVLQLRVHLFLGKLQGRAVDHVFKPWFGKVRFSFQVLANITFLDENAPAIKTKPNPKLTKYPNAIKFLYPNNRPIVEEQEPNPNRTEKQMDTRNIGIYPSYQLYLDILYPNTQITILRLEDVNYFRSENIKITKISKSECFTYTNICEMNGNGVQFSIGRSILPESEYVLLIINESYEVCNTFFILVSGELEMLNIDDVPIFDDLASQCPKNKTEFVFIFNPSFFFCNPNFVVIVHNFLIIFCFFYVLLLYTHKFCKSINKKCENKKFYKLSKFFFLNHNSLQTNLQKTNHITNKKKPVYRGTFSDGRMVALKVLKDLKDNSGEDFINELASMSQTSHVNIVTLLGFCFEGYKRAIIYEFMENGSLDKYISSKLVAVGALHKKSSNMDWMELYGIALGVARGLKYLHHGCRTRIVYFVIKPQNVLLDDNLSPKVSHFGLAKLCDRKVRILSLLDTRGTIGYIAPEVFSRVYGRVSHKSDVYSYGMLVLEIIGARNKSSTGDNTTSSTSSIYFPEWIYRDLEKADNGRNIENAINNEEDEIAKKTTLVGLWCIQPWQSDLPKMNKVEEMMEGNLDALEVPPRPVLQQIPTTTFQDSSTFSED
ncbi:unnamed protein product, partial [Arabidopsis halleri]